MNEYTGKVIKKFNALPEEYEYLQDMSGCNKPTFQFLLHVTASTLLKLKELPEERFSPIYCKLIRENFGRNVNWRLLRERQIIEVKPYCRESGRSRQFKLADWVVANLLEIAHSYSFDEHLDLELVNLMTGKPARSKLRSIFWDDNRNREPELYTRAIVEIGRNGSYFNYDAVAAVVNGRRAKAEKLLAEEGPKSEAYLKAYLQWQNDYYCFLSVLRQRPVPVGNGIWRYEPAYKPAKTGRAQQIGGGFQSASVEVKAAAIEGLEDCFNYDLAASQLNVLKLQFRIAGMESRWLNKYLTTENCKRVYAERAGLSEKTWKTCLIALMMGASLPAKPRAPKKKGRENSVLKKLWKESEGDLARLAVALTGFTDVIGPLLDDLAGWHNWLVEQFIPNNTKWSRRGAYILNDVGKLLYLDTLPDEENKLWQKKAKVAAFLLQGTEQAYIHTLTVLGPKYGFRVIANEHDGVISLGRIPPEAQAEAAELSGFTEAKLVIKPFQERLAA